MRLSAVVWAITVLRGRFVSPRSAIYQLYCGPEKYRGRFLSTRILFRTRDLADPPPARRRSSSFFFLSAETKRTGPNARTDQKRVTHRITLLRIKMLRMLHSWQHVNALSSDTESRNARSFDIITEGARFNSREASSLRAPHRVQSRSARYASSCEYLLIRRSYSYFPGKDRSTLAIIAAVSDPRPR